MFRDVVEAISGLDDTALDARIRDLELQRRELEAEQAAAIRVAEARGCIAWTGTTR